MKHATTETKRNNNNNNKKSVSPRSPLFQGTALTPIMLHKLETVSTLQFQNATSAIEKKNSTWVTFKN